MHILNWTHCFVLLVAHRIDERYHNSETSSSFLSAHAICAVVEFEVNL